MVNLYDAVTGQHIGSINGEQLQFLIDQLEEESLEDRDYAITRMTVDFLETQGGDPGLIDLLRQALGGRDEVTIRWSRTVV
jgi:processive 1,2-diacylglycerol beta-glucosyltransferase